MTARVHDLKHLGTNQRVARIGKAAFTGHFIKMHHPVQDFTVTAHIAQFLTQTVRRKLVIAFPKGQVGSPVADKLPDHGAIPMDS